MGLSLKFESWASNLRQIGSEGLEFEERLLLTITTWLHLRQDHSVEKFSTVSLVFQCVV